MSPDTPDPHRPVDRPDAPDRAVPDPTGAGEPPADPRPPAEAQRLAEARWPADPHHPAPWPPVYAAAPVTRDRPRRTAVVALATALGVALLGVPLGLLWAVVAPDTPVVKTAQGAVYAQPQPEQPIAADGWFSVLGLAFGLLCAVGLWVLLRRRRGPVTLLAVALGTLGAGLLAWQVGRRIGLSGYERLLADAPEGTAFTKPADLRAGGIERLFGVLPVPFGDVLLPAFAAAVAYTLLAGWSRWPSLRPEPDPYPSAGPFSPPGPFPPAGPPGPVTPAGPPGPVPPAGPSGPVPSGGVSSGSGATPAPTAAPEPPAPGAAGPPRG